MVAASARRVKIGLRAADTGGPYDGKADEIRQTRKMRRLRRLEHLVGRRGNVKISL